MGFSFQIPGLESCKPELKNCRTKSSQFIFEWSGNLSYDVLRHARLNTSIILVDRIILLIDGK